VARNGLGAWRILVMATFYVVVFLGFDLALGQWMLRSSDPASRHAVADPVYHHALAPNVLDSPDQWGPLSFRVHTNSLGFRDLAPREVPLRSEGRRILLLGDSFAFGVGYDYPETFAGIFGRVMAEEGVTVLNAAVVSYSPIIHVRKLERLLVEVGLEVDEVLVFLDISDVKNDAIDYGVDAEGRVFFAEDRQWANVLRRRLPLSSELSSRFAGLLGGRRSEAVGWSTRGSDAGMWTVDDALYEAWGKRGLDAMAQRMDRIHRMLEERGIRLTVAVYPWPDQVLAADRDSRQARFWRAWASERGVGFLDFFPDFVAGEGSANRRAVERYFIPGDIHFNREGNRYFAARLVERYRTVVR
jgi:hypothetical protein